MKECGFIIDSQAYKNIINCYTSLIKRGVDLYNTPVCRWIPPWEFPPVDTYSKKVDIYKSFLSKFLFIVCYRKKTL